MKYTRPKNGCSRWFVRVMVDVLVDRGETARREKALYLGFRTGPKAIGKREAEAIRDEQLRTINRAPDVIQSQVPFRDLAKAYLDTFVPSLKPGSRRTYTHAIEKHILPAFADAPLYKIGSIEVQRWVYSMEKDGLGTRSCTLKLAVLRSVFEWAELAGYYRGANPCKRIRVSDRPDVHSRRALTPEEACKLVAVCPEPLRLMVEVALFTGLRVAEIRGLTWDSIDHTLRILTVRQARSHDSGEIVTPKTSKGRRVVPLGPLVSRFEKRNSSALIWPETDYFRMQEALRDLAGTAGIKFAGFGWHTLRRTYATFRHMLGSAEMPDAALVQAMGHSSASTTAVYVQGQRDVVAALQDLIFFSGAKPS